MNYKKLFIPLVIFSLLGIWVTYLGIPDPYYYEIEPVSGFLVDEETGEPIEGAALTALWGAQEGFFIRPQSSGWWLYQYDKTDARGYFYFPGVLRSKRKWFSSRGVSDYQPWIRILKSAYRPVSTMAAIHAGRHVSYATEKRQKKEWRVEVVKGMVDKTIQLERLPEDPIERYNIFHGSFLILGGGYEYICDNKSLIDSGWNQEIVKEQKIAVQNSLLLEISDTDRYKILNDQFTAYEACIYVRLAKMHKSIKNYRE